MAKVKNSFQAVTLKSYRTWIQRFSFILVFAVIACTKVNFSQNSSCGNNCTAVLGSNNYNYNVTGSSQPIDILFVVDNSQSMYAVQQSIGSKFPSMFTTLSNFDYHIAITTTDISNLADPSVYNPPAPINNNGALQDGHLILFPDGTSYLSHSSSNQTVQFADTIQRKETLDCDNWVAANCPASGCNEETTAYDFECPSQDTRAIFAADLTLMNDGTGFLRPNVPLAVVIISNSDERATGGVIADMPLEANDEPYTLFSTAQSKGINLSAYPIIIMPGDSSCYNANYTSSISFGWYGTVYSQLTSNPLAGGSSGMVGSICSSNFSQPLNAISAQISNNLLSTLSLNCAPIGGTVTITNSNGSTRVLSTSANNPLTVQLPTPLQPNQSINVQYSCNAN